MPIISLYLSHRRGNVEGNMNHNVTKYRSYGRQSGLFAKSIAKMPKISIKSSQTFGRSHSINNEMKWRKIYFIHCISFTQNVEARAVLTNIANYLSCPHLVQRPIKPEIHRHEIESIWLSIYAMRFQILPLYGMFLSWGSHREMKKREAIDITNRERKWPVPQSSADRPWNNGWQHLKRYIIVAYSKQILMLIIYDSDR